MYIKYCQHHTILLADTPRIFLVLRAFHFSQHLVELQTIDGQNTNLQVNEFSGTYASRIVYLGQN